MKRALSLPLWTYSLLEKIAKNKQIIVRNVIKAVTDTYFLLTMLYVSPLIPRTRIHQKYSLSFCTQPWMKRIKQVLKKELFSLPLKWWDGLPVHLEPLTVSLSHWSHHLYLSASHSTGYGECLLNEPESRPYPLPPQLPGLLYNVNKQCELIFGPGSQVCPYMVSVWGPFLPS